MKDDLSFEEMQNLGVTHNFGLSHGRSCKALSHPVDSKEQDEEALGKKVVPQRVQKILPGLATDQGRSPQSDCFHRTDVEEGGSKRTQDQTPTVLVLPST